MLKKKSLLNTGFLLIGISSVLCIVFFGYLSDYIIYFIENNFLDDNTIETPNKLGIRLYLVFFIVISLIFSFLGIEKVRIKIFNHLAKFIDIYKVNFFLFSDGYTLKSYSYFSFTLSSLVSFVLAFYFLIAGAPTPEGLMENIMATFFLLSACIFLLSIIELVFKKENIQNRNSITYLLVFLLISMLFIFFEEFSWGMNLFNWTINDFFLEYNFQKEISFHNFFNPLFPIIYPLFGFLILLSCLGIWFFSTPLKSTVRGIFEPHPSLFFLVLIMCSFSVRAESEFFEEFFAIFTLFYSYRIFLCIRYPALKTRRKI